MVTFLIAGFVRPIVKSSSLALAALGALLSLAGATFTLQGYGVVGPGSSFMFQNTTWVYVGSVVLAVGLLIIAGVVYASRSARSASD